MRSTAIGILVVFLSVAFLQPMIETANVFKEKVALGAAIRNCCRAASNYALVDDVYVDWDRGSRPNLDAVIDKEKFAEYFAEAFGNTFEIGSPDIIGDFDTLIFPESERWDNIRIELDFEDMAGLSSTDYDLGYNAAILTIELTTPYVFRTKLMQQAMGSLDKYDFTISENRKFMVKVIN
ncbi:MAG: hypothetical protein LBB91_00615 [Clostridiales bacterium]|jgi:hypothetical protein|nr:hypothetical protein [Clostridiales bacterium]